MSPSKPSNTDDGAPVLAGIEVPSSRSTAGPTAVILPFRSRTAAASWDLEDEGPDDCFESIGTLAVHLVGNFTRPSILVWSAPEDGEEEHPREL